MRKKYSIIHGALSAAIALAAFTSCIKENLDGCVDPSGSVRISLELDKTVQPETSLLDYGVDNVSVFVFDAENRYVTTANGGAYTAGDYTITIDLPGGHYHFVVWTNQGDSYQTNKTKEQLEADYVLKEEMEYFLQCDGGEAIRHEIPDLLFGKTSHQVVNNLDNHVVVPMAPNTYTINVRVKGLPETGDNFDFTITDNNSHYTFDNAIVGDKDNFLHLRSCTQVQNELEVSFKTLKLAHGRSPQFVFKNATKDEVLFSNCLVQTIVSAYEAAGQQVDFDKTHTFEILLAYEIGLGDDTELAMTVSVNGWDYDPTDQILK